MTRLEIYMELFPEAMLDDNDYPLNTLPCEVASCPYSGIECDDECKEKFWDVECGFGLVKNDTEVKL